MVDYRVWLVVNPPNDASYYDVGSVEEAKRLLKDLYAGFQNVFCVGGLEERDPLDNKWYEWYSEEGDDISGIVREEE